MIRGNFVEDKWLMVSFKIPDREEMFYYFNEIIEENEQPHKIRNFISF